MRATLHLQKTIAVPSAPSAERTRERIWERIFTPYRKRIVRPVASVGAAFLVALAIADFGQGINGALWSFPAILLSYFVLPRRLANAVGVLLLLAGTAIIYVYHDTGTTVRYFLSLLPCLVVANIILDMLDSLHERLLALSLTDALTGAFNRRHMDASFDDVIERHRRTSAPASVLLLDIDHFKRVNDSFGHEAGDRVLRAIATLVQKRRRKLDLLFRMGGEEFVLLLPDTRSTEALAVAEQLRAAIARARILDGETVTVSIGVSELHAGDTAGAWMQRADAALYRAKAAGRNRVNLGRFDRRGQPDRLAA